MSNDIVTELRARAGQGRFNLEAAETIESLRQQLAAAEEKSRSFEQECKDTDALLEIIGIGQSGRTDGGFVNIGKVKAYQQETLDSLAESQRFGAAQLEAAKGQGEPVYMFRRRGLDKWNWCSCDKDRFMELKDNPNLFDVRICSDRPSPSTEKVSQEPVAEYIGDHDSHYGMIKYLVHQGDVMKAGDKLYTTQPTAALIRELAIRECIKALEENEQFYCRDTLLALIPQTSNLEVHDRELVKGAVNTAIRLYRNRPEYTLEEIVDEVIGELK